MRGRDKEKLIKKNSFKYMMLILIFIAALVILGLGFWMYQKSIGNAVYSTTVSFMEQIADHDRMNIVNQMNSKWEYLNSLMNRLEKTRDPEIDDVVYYLGVESKATSFEKLYLVTEDNTVFSSSFMETTLDDMPWKDVFEKSKGDFVSQYSEDSREQWGEYFVYGSHLTTPVSCGETSIAGVVGLVPISDIASQMQLESFDQRGIAVVITSTGDIITASKFYSDTESQNYLTRLEDAEFSKGSSVDICGEAIGKGEKLFVSYELSGEGYYTLFQPLEDDKGNNWFLVVQVSEQVATEQVTTLLWRSVPFFILIGVFMFFVIFAVYRNVNAARVARASEHAKSTFLANMSHEIRTPLNGIVGLHYLMRQNLCNPEKMKEYLSKAEVSADFLKSVITDVLDMSKIESGQLEIFNNDIDLTVLIGEIQVLTEIQTGSKGIELCINCRDIINPTVTSDALRIKQILTNLLGNAVKFTSKGGKVSLTVRQQIKGDIAYTSFIVQDTGCGMSREFLERIWMPFEQERRIASQNGTGLGTTLSKTLAEKMGGSITVESQEGIGTTFNVLLPLKTAENPAAKETDTVSTETEWELKGKRILIAEDNDINRMIVVSILEEEGALTIEAVNGKDVVERFADSDPYFFDLILMDVQMPLLNGYEATEQIRRLKRADAAAIPIIAITANAFSEEIDKALASGMNEVATKPLDIALLLNKIRNIKNQEDEK